MFIFSRVTVATVFLFSVSAPLMGQRPDAMRTWADPSGRFTTEAELVRFDREKAVLKQRDGTLIEVPIASLSGTDRDYVKSRESLKPPAIIEVVPEEVLKASVLITSTTDGLKQSIPGFVLTKANGFAYLAYSPRNHFIRANSVLGATIVNPDGTTNDIAAEGIGTYLDDRVAGLKVDAAQFSSTLFDLPVGEAVQGETVRMIAFEFERGKPPGWKVLEATVDMVFRDRAGKVTHLELSGDRVRMHAQAFVLNANNELLGVTYRIDTEDRRHIYSTVKVKRPELFKPALQPRIMSLKEPVAKSGDQAWQIDLAGEIFDLTGEGNVKMLAFARNASNPNGAGKYAPNGHEVNLNWRPQPDRSSFAGTVSIPITDLQNETHIVLQLKNVTDEGVSYSRPLPVEVKLPATAQSVNSVELGEGHWEIIWIAMRALGGACIVSVAIVFWFVRRKYARGVSGS